jgi:hypothetical protein
MKNIQVIDAAENCVYDIFSATEEEFFLLFPAGTDIAFIDEIHARVDSELLDKVFANIWKRPVKKSEAMGIHGTILYELAEKKAYHPTRRDEDAINPDGSRLR